MGNKDGNFESEMDDGCWMLDIGSVSLTVSDQGGARLPFDVLTNRSGGQVAEAQVSGNTMTQKRQVLNFVPRKPNDGSTYYYIRLFNSSRPSYVSLDKKREYSNIFPCKCQGTLFTGGNPTSHLNFQLGPELN